MLTAGLYPVVWAQLLPPRHCAAVGPLVRGGGIADGLRRNFGGHFGNERLAPDRPHAALSPLNLALLFAMTSLTLGGLLALPVARLTNLFWARHHEAIHGGLQRDGQRHLGPGA